MKNKVFKKLKMKRSGYRFVGWFFIIIGGFLCITFAKVMLDPDGVITYNGVETTSFEIKRNAFLFAITFPVIGAVCAFIPKRYLTKLLVWQARTNPFFFGTKRK